MSSRSCQIPHASLRPSFQKGLGAVELLSALGHHVKGPRAPELPPPLSCYSRPTENEGWMEHTSPAPPYGNWAASTAFWDPRGG